MDQSIEQRLDHIEHMLVEMNAKIDHYLGVETLTGEEKREIEALRQEVREGKFLTYNEVFKD